MRYCSIFFSLLFLVSCTHAPKCGNPDGAKLVFENKTSCMVRIRQVEIGTDLRIPQSLKNPELSLLELTWIDPVFSNGIIELGHFRLLPQVAKNKKDATGE